MVTFQGTILTTSVDQLKEKKKTINIIEEEDGKHEERETSIIDIIHNLNTYNSYLGLDASRHIINFKSILDFVRYDSLGRCVRMISSEPHKLW